MLLLVQQAAEAGTSGSATPVILWVLQIVEILVIAASAGLIWLQIHKNHEWRRRKASHDFLYQLISGNFRVLREKLEYGFGVEYRDKSQNYETVRRSLGEDEDKRELYVKTSALFNYFEELAVGIKNNVLDDDICFDMAAPLLIEYRRWGAPLIEERSPEGYRTTWVEFVSLVDEWKDRREEQERAAEELREKAEKRARDGIRVPGKSRL